MILNLKKVLATTLLTCVFSIHAAIVINEVDYDQAGVDTAEFIELYNNGAVAVDMTGYTLELFNGSGAQSLYQTLSLPAQMLAADSYFVICTNFATVTNCDLDTLNSIQNGAPDGMALRDATTAVVDALSYEGVTTAPYSEGTSAPTDIGNAANADMGISRAPNGTDTNDNGADFIYKSITPGAANTLPPSSFSIDDVIQIETNAGTTNFIFTVTISATADATVDWATSDGTATTADSDYVAVAATTLTFTNGGATTQTVTVVVNGDTIIESDETFNVDLSNATGGTTITDAQGVGTITNDDSASFAIDNVAIVEGNAGTSTLNFTVTKTGNANASVDWATSDGTATTADSDYVGVAATTLNFAAATATQMVSVTINGDTFIEADETFNVDLSNVTGGATISDALGIGTINNDDSVQAILMATKSVSGDLSPGGTAIYTIVVSNIGPNPQNDNPGDEMTDILPASLSVQSVSATSGTAGNVGNTVSWNGSIPASGSVTVTINALIDSGAAGTIENQAEVFFDNNGDGTNESSSLSSPPMVMGAAPTAFFIAFMIPSLNQFALLLLMLSLVSVVYFKTRKNC